MASLRKGDGFTCIESLLLRSARVKEEQDIHNKLIFHVMGALAAFERNLKRSRTNAGLATAVHGEE